MRYLYIFEDQTIKQGGKPSTDDLQNVSDGYLQIIQISDDEIVDICGDGGTEPLEVIPHD